MKRHSSSRPYLWALPLVAFVCLLFAHTKANAVPVVGLTITDRLVFFDSGAPGAIVALVSVTGLQPGEHIIAVDFRPLTGQIYALGSASRLYKLNPVTGAAIQVGSGPFTPSLNGIEFGFDFDPTTDHLRVVSNTGQNLRLDPNTGAVVSADSALTFAPGESEAGMTPDVTGVAYTNNFQGATTSTLYAIDWRRGQLQRIGSPNGSPVSPNTGQVFTVGTLATAFQITELVGFDIAPNGGTAYASLRSGDALSSSLFYTINLSTGAATQQGQIGGGEFIRDVTVIDRAVDILAITVSNKLLRFKSGTPGTIIHSVNITNLQSVNEQIVALYLFDGKLHCITNASHIYRLDTTTGEASFFGSLPTHPLVGTNFGLTNTPQGYLQSVSDADQNSIVNPHSPPGSAPRTPLAYAAGDPHAGQNPNVVGAAFTRGEPVGATMFDIDSNLDILARQGAADNNPLSFESGQLFTIGTLGVDTTGMVGFDIELSPLICPCNNTALRTGATFASLTAPGDTVSRLYSIDLRTGAASLQGTIGGDEVVRDIVAVQIIGLFGFSQISFFGSEGAGSIPVTVTRSGDTNVAASVDYETSDGAGGARQAQDYTYASGRLYFEPGENTKTIQVLITDDGFSGEGTIGESIYFRLSNPTAGFGLDNIPGFLGPGATEVRIIDNDSAPAATNPIDDPEFFVRQHYRDFLNRDADPAGLAFWKNEITSCGADAACVERKRINVSAAFFLSIEFQNTGFLVHRLYEASFNRMPLYRELMQGTQKIGRGLVVGESGWEAKLGANSQAFLNEWVNCKAFKDLFDAKTNAEYVDALFANVGIVPAAAERQALISGLDNHTETRASVLRRVAENQEFEQIVFNEAFVLIEYFGYLRRNPSDAPDSNMNGYNFWLAKLNQFNGNYIEAEMVKAFITSSEYRQRFGP